MTDDLHSNCDALLQSLSEYLDGTLSGDMCRELLKHLEDCGNCRAVLNTTRRTIDLVQLQPGETPDLPVDVRDRLFRRLDLERFLDQRGD
jgi:anti-sigma factor RsiW